MSYKQTPQFTYSLVSSLFFFFFNVDHFKSLYWICYSIATVFSFFFGHKARGILAPVPVPSALEGKVLITGPPGKSPGTVLIL